MPKLCSIIFWVKGLPLLIFMCVVVSLIIFFSLITCFIAPSDFVRVTFDLTHPFKAVVLKLWGGPPWWDVEPLQVRWGWLREKKNGINCWIESGRVFIVAILAFFFKWMRGSSSDWKLLTRWLVSKSSANEPWIILFFQTVWARFTNRHHF